MDTNIKITFDHSAKVYEVFHKNVIDNRVEWLGCADTFIEALNIVKTSGIEE